MGVDRIDYSTKKARPYLFCVGKLQFGFHGMLGVFTMGLTFYVTRFPNTRIIAILQIALFVLNMQAKDLIRQAPTTTQIIPGFVASHRIGFERTIAIMNYLIFRLFLKCISEDDIFANNTVARQLLHNMSILILVITWLLLLPNDWAMATNGNTFVVVIPIAFGAGSDLLQFTLFDEDMTEITQLLNAEMVGLVLAFGFTLALRGYLYMNLIYAMSIASIWTIDKAMYQMVRTGLREYGYI